MAAFLLGSLMPFAFSPYDYKWLAVLAFAGWILLFMRGKAFSSGWAFGLGWFGIGAWWLAPTFHTFGPLAWPWAILATTLVGFVLGLFPACLAWGSYRLVEKGAGKGAGDSPRMLVVFPIMMVGEEWLRGHLFTGLPWTPPGSLLLDTPAIGWAAIVGVYGAAFLPALLAVSLAFILRFKYYRWGLAGAAIAGVCLLAAPAPYRADGAVHRVALIQANIPQKLKWNADFLNETMHRYVRLSKQAAKQSDLIIWPEVAVPLFLERAPEWRAWLLRHMDEWKTPVLFGGLKLDDGGRLAKPVAHNGIYLFQPGRETLQFVGKQHLVPFGEYVPSWIPFLHALVPNIADFQPSEDSGVLQGAHGRYGSLVCYEAIFPREARQRAATASVLINVTNDAWYGHTPATWQHLQAARMRAVETGRYLLRAANTGVSAIVAPDGTIQQTMDWFTQGAVLGEYRDSDVRTPYQRWGDVPLLGLVVPLLFVVWAGWRNT
ncbi:MAG: apolipoprotein N-acyltransferase [Mariprofundaceae bacterium]|nr:apolipoprotein N-acyltransferase [Mariprofundaceae bacterium]